MSNLDMLSQIQNCSSPDFPTGTLTFNSASDASSATSGGLPGGYAFLFDPGPTNGSSSIYPAALTVTDDNNGVLYFQNGVACPSITPAAPGSATSGTVTAGSFITVNGDNTLSCTTISPLSASRKTKFNTTWK